MTYFFPNVDPTYIYRRKGTEDDPFLFLQDTNHIRKGTFVLKEIPSFTDGFEVVGSDGQELDETDSDELDINEYRVDYSVGIAYFNEDRSGEEITCQYYGTGYVSISASRIWMMGESDDPLKSLQEALEDVSAGIETLEQVGDLDFVGDYSESHSYKKWNFVNYKKQTYVATRDSQGITPDNDTHWRFVSGGIGVSGVYDSSTIYSIGDMVSDELKKNLYVSKKDNNEESLDNTDSWENIITLDDTVVFIEEEMNRQKNSIQALMEDLEESESIRDQNEEERDSLIIDGLAQMELAKEDIEENEDDRKEKETERLQAENIRIQNEEDREQKELAREDSEDIRKQEESLRKERFDDSINSVGEAIESAQESAASIDETKNELESLVDESTDIIDGINLTVEELNGWENQREYSDTQQYYKNNFVLHDGSTYQALQDVIGVAPDYVFEGEEGPEEENEESEENEGDGEDTDILEGVDCWVLVAAKGMDGDSITVEGVEPDDNRDISLEDLGIVKSEEFDDYKNDIDILTGDLSRLRTVNKNNLVESINELKSRIDDLVELLT